MSENEKKMNDIIIQLTKDVVWTRILWDIHEEVYCTSEDRFNKIFDAIGLISNAMKHSLLVEMQLSICRMADNAVTGKGKNAAQNATLRQLAIVSAECGLSNISNKINESADRLDKEANNIKLNRNKFLGHSDLENLLKTKSNSAHEIDLCEAERCICIIEDCLSSVNTDCAEMIKNSRANNKQRVISEVGNIDEFIFRSKDF